MGRASWPFVLVHLERGRITPYGRVVQSAVTAPLPPNRRPPAPHGRFRPAIGAGRSMVACNGSRAAARKSGLRLWSRGGSARAVAPHAAEVGRLDPALGEDGADGAAQRVE